MIQFCSESFDWLTCWSDIDPFTSKIDVTIKFVLIFVAVVEFYCCYYCLDLDLIRSGSSGPEAFRYVNFTH